MKTYIVGIVHTSLSHFSVKAENDDDALEKAKLKFRESKDEVMLGNEYDDIERTFIDCKT